MSMIDSIIDTAKSKVRDINAADVAKFVGSALMQGTTSTRSNTTRNYAWAAGLGVLAGVGLGMLLAPQSGRKTRNDVSRWMGKAFRQAKDKAGELANQAKDAAENVAEHIEDGYEKVSGAVRSELRDAKRSFDARSNERTDTRTTAGASVTKKSDNASA